MHWYVIQSKPKQETRAEENLRAWQVETLLPRMMRPARAVSGTRAQIEPLFPGYLFARFDIDLMFYKMRHTRGVTKILGTSAGPTPLADDVIALLRDRMDQTGLVNMNASLRPGDSVRIIGGPFKNFIAVFDHATTATQRVTVLLSTLNTQVRVALDSHLIERVG